MQVTCVSQCLPYKPAYNKTSATAVAQGRGGALR